MFLDTASRDCEQILLSGILEKRKRMSVVKMRVCITVLCSQQMLSKYYFNGSSWGHLQRHNGNKQQWLLSRMWRFSYQAVTKVDNETTIYNLKKSKSPCVRGISHSGVNQQWILQVLQGCRIQDIVGNTAKRDLELELGVLKDPWESNQSPKMHRLHQIT